jgi:hypothetical protein
MKGWLDNFGKADNANDSNVSLPEGFVGLGYNTKGRNYSPAWGGQFQDGGELIPIAQGGVTAYMNKKMQEEKDRGIAAQYNLPEVVVQGFRDPSPFDQAARMPQYDPIPTVPYLEKTKDPAEFFKSWITSPEYRRRKIETGYAEYPEYSPVTGDEIDDPYKGPLIDRAMRNNFLKLEQIQRPGAITYDPKRRSEYFEEYGEANVNPKDYAGDINTVKAHEIAHAVDTKESDLSRKEVDLLYSATEGWGKRLPDRLSPELWSKVQDAQHLIKPRELRADLNALRFLMYDKDIYDIRKGKEFTKEDLEKAKEKLKGNQSLDRTLMVTGDDNLIKLMNIIAKKDEELTPIAMNGASMPGAVGFTYARTAGSAPSKGKYAKKTMASAQIGKNIEKDETNIDTNIANKIAGLELKQNPEYQYWKYQQSLPQLRQAPGRSEQLIRQGLGYADVATDVMQMGNFIPHPTAQAVGRVGNIAGMIVDGLQGADEAYRGNYLNAGINLASVALPTFLGANSFRRNTMMLRPGDPLYQLTEQARRAANSPINLNKTDTGYLELFSNVKGMTDKSLLTNRVLLGILGAETAYDAGAIGPVKKEYGGEIPSAQNGIMSPLLLGRKILEYIYPSEEAANTVKAAPANYKKGLTNELLQRQAYKESTFNPAAVSPAGYKGLTQIGEGVLQDYSNKKGGKKLDPFNPKDAVELQKFAMDDLYNADFINKPNQSDSVRIAKTLAAYNWGRGNLYNYLGEQKKKGVDIYNSYEWLQNLPKETSDYVNKILLQKDASFNKNYGKDSINPKYKSVTSLYDSKKYGGDIPSAQNGEEDIKTIDLPEITITPDYDEQYPFYQSLSNEQKKYINDSSPIGRATRALAATGKRGQTASDISNLVRDVEKFAYDYTGIPGTIRFANDPVNKLLSFERSLFNTITGSSPFLPTTPYDPKDLPGTFDALDAFGLGSAMAAPLIKPIQQGLKTASLARGLKPAVKLSKAGDPLEVVSKISSQNIPSASSTTIAQAPTSWSMQEAPGLHLKSTMSGSPLEKQLSKAGTINVNNIKAHIGKAETGNQDKFIMQKVLDEKFPGQAQINYDDFRKAISEELVPLERNIVLDYKHTNYGVNKLGYPAEQKSFYENSIDITKRKIEEAEQQLKGKIEPTSWKSASQVKADLKIHLRDLKERLAGEIKKYEDIPLEQVSITYKNPSQFGAGDARHFDDTTLGHARTLVSKEEPDVMHILEQQSDYFQNLEKGKPIDLQKEAERLSKLETNYLNDLEILENIKKNRVDVEGNPMNDFQIAQFEEMVNKRGAELNLRKGNIANPEQKEFFGKAYQERLMQENVKYAAEQGKSKVRFPTSETSANIQGYVPSNLRRELNNRIEELAEVRKEIGFTDMADDDILPMNLYGYRSLSETPVTKSKYLELLNNRIKELKSLPDKQLDANVYKPEHQGILKKYAEQPKTIKKLFGVEPKIVKDAKGNSWYEFDIPKSFKEGKGEIRAFKNGGKMTTAQNGQEMKFYQNGLDWKPKSMQNGGEEIYEGRELPEFVVEGKDERLKQAMYEGSNRFLQGALGVMGAPQVVTMDWLTGKQQTPSEAWGFQNPGGWLDSYSSFGKNLGNFAMDAVLDPLNAFGAGIADDIARNAARGVFRTVGTDPAQSSFGELFRAFNPRNLKTQSGLDWSKGWYEHPEALQRKIKIASVDANDDLTSKAAERFSNDFIETAKESLNQYEPKSYIDLLKDKGFKDYFEYGLNTGGLSYGRPDQVYINRPMYFPFDKKGLESTRVHELSHLTNRNGRGLTSTEENMLLKPFGFEDDITRLKKVGEIKSKSKKKWSSYYTTPTEVKARMDQARFDLNLSPEDKFTPEMFDKISKKNDFYGMGDYIKDKKAFIDLMNNFWAVPAVGVVVGSQAIDEQKNGGITKDNQGYWNPDNWGKPVEIDSNIITMQGVYEPLLGISDTGDTKLMQPGKDYKFKGKKVTEYPVAKLGINQLDAQPMKKLNQLLNFTNNPDKDNWLDKYN